MAYSLGSPVPGARTRAARRAPVAHDTPRSQGALRGRWGATGDRLGQAPRTLDSQQSPGRSPAARRAGPSGVPVQRPARGVRGLGLRGPL